MYIYIYRERDRERERERDSSTRAHYSRSPRRSRRAPCDKLATGPAKSCATWRHNVAYSIALRSKP